MPDYQHGKIYQIIAPDGSKYIGSTTKPLNIRFSNHKADYKRHVENKKKMKASCLRLFEEFGYELLKVELIELYPCNCRSELIKREGELIRTIDCVNKRIEGRTTAEYIKDTIERRRTKRVENIDEYKKRDKEYYIKNSEKIKEKARLNWEKNASIMSERRRELRLLNKEHVNQKQREYWSKHKDELNARRRVENKIPKENLDTKSS